jgi:hypothetical protein
LTVVTEPLPGLKTPAQKSSSAGNPSARPACVRIPTQARSSERDSVKVRPAGVSPMLLALALTSRSGLLTTVANRLYFEKSLLTHNWACHAIAGHWLGLFSNPYA